MLNAQQRLIVEGPNPAVISTVDQEGRAVTVPTWHLLDGDDVLLSIDAENPRGNRLEHLRNDPRFTLTVLDNDNWSNSITIFATVIEMFPDENLELVDRMARVHGKPRFERRDRRVALRARIDGTLATSIHR